MDEAFSDIFACLLDGYLYGDTDWMIGAYTDPNTGESSTGMRNIRDCGDYKENYIKDYLIYQTDGAKDLNIYQISTILSHTAYLIYNGVDGNNGYKDLYTSKEAFNKILHLYYAALKYMTYSAPHGPDYMDRVAATICYTAAEELALSQEERTIIFDAFHADNLLQEYIASESLADLVNAYIKANGITPAPTQPNENISNMDPVCNMKFQYYNRKEDKSDEPLAYESIVFDDLDLDTGVVKMYYYHNISGAESEAAPPNGTIVTDELIPLMTQLHDYILVTVPTTKELSYQEVDDPSWGKLQQTMWHQPEDTPIEEIDPEIITLHFTYNGHNYTFVANKVSGILSSTVKFIDQKFNLIEGTVMLSGFISRD